MQAALTIRIAVITALILFLLLPLGLINNVVKERAGYRYDVEEDIADTWTGSQRLVGPVLSIPYTVKYEEKIWDKELQKYQVVEKTRTQLKYVIPETLTIDGQLSTEQRSRGIYSVPVYAGQFAIEGEFSAAELEEFRLSVPGFDQWEEPRLSLAIRDVRGIGRNPAVSWDGVTESFNAGTGTTALPDGIHAMLPVPTAGDAMRFAIELELRGSVSLRLTPAAKESTTRLQSTWPHPKFTGRFLPVEREISAQGFSARWQNSIFSNNVQQQLASCLQGDCSALDQGTFGVQLFESVDIYQKIRRATKYGILFILLTFVAFFLTETLVNKPLHPVQYVLVGFALCIFYLLLISLSEHYGFTVAYAMATLSCVFLIGTYLTGVLGNAKQGFSYALGIALLYAMLFVILRSEDFALLMGTLLLFVMLAAVMLMTRRVNWYEVGAKINRLRPEKGAKDVPDGQHPDGGQLPLS